VAEVAHWAGERLAYRGVVSRATIASCAQPRPELIEQDIHELHLTRVVVAACSPHQHEATFAQRKNAG
jgi:heterodisulfide reductase subunit A